MSITSNLAYFLSQIKNHSCKLVAVSKTYPESFILEAYKYGHKIFGENKVQEMVDKYENLPKDIEWHLIGHLQTNKVKYIAPFVHLIQSVDSAKLLRTIDKEARKNGRKIHCLLQIHIAEEETKFGFSYEEVEAFLKGEEIKEFKNIVIAGLMGMATNTSDQEQIRKEFLQLSAFNQKMNQELEGKFFNISLKELSIGMSSDYNIALEAGSTMIRIGTGIFGSRNYH